LDEVDVQLADLRDSAAIEALVNRVRPDEIYNFAAFSTGSRMHENPVAMGDINGLAVVRILEAIRYGASSARFCQASSSEMFRETDRCPQDESTPLAPASSYGAAKAYAHQSIRVARERDNIFACSAILFNHESSRRSSDFVTRKITRAAAEIYLGKKSQLVLGDLQARRDWTHARDVVNGMWLMLQQEQPRDYVLATGETHSVSDLCEIAFTRLGLDWKECVRVDPMYSRRAEASQLVGNASRAREELGWMPSTSFRAMITGMVDADLRELQLATFIGEKSA
jgi:GDPmannose 4,6-dehydratase